VCGPNTLFYQSIPHMSRFILGCLAACMWAGAPATAAERPRLAVLPLAASEAELDPPARRLSAQLAQRLGRRVELELVTVAAPLGTRSEGRAALEEGRRAWEGLRFEEAVAALRRGLAVTLAEPATVEVPELAQAWALLAGSLFRMGQEREAKQALLELCRLAPGATLPPGFPPVFQGELERARRRVAKLPRGRLALAGPAGATVFLDGRAMGRLPLALGSLSVGAHLLQVEGPRGGRFGQLVEVAAGVTRVQVMLAATVAAPEPRPGLVIDEAALEQLLAWARGAGLDWVLVGAVGLGPDRGVEARTALISTERGTFAALAPVALDADAARGELQAGALGEAVLEAVLRRPRSAEPVTPPLILASRVRGPLVASGPSSDELEPIAPRRGEAGLALVPPEAPAAAPAAVVAATVPAPGPVAAVRPAVPVWVWVAAGAVVAAGAGVGGYFGYRAATRPVSGTVTASW
jgi:hypothetical protein